MLIRLATQLFLRGGVLFLTAVLFTRAQAAPIPTIAVTVNSASYLSPVAPGSLVSIFGSDLASSTQSANTTPLPTNLGSVTVTFDGVDAPLLFVSPGQINAQVPTSIADGNRRIFVSQVVVTTAAGSSAPAGVQVYSVAPAFFTQDGSGCGAAAALNVTADGSTSLNTPQHSVAPGDYITLFGTGLGVAMMQPIDGVPTTSAAPFAEPGALHFDWAAEGITPSYSGLAPNLAGASQVNIQIPATMREGCAVPLSMDADALLWASPTVTISVAKNRGQCSDPPVASYGEVTLERTIAVGTTSDGETDTFTARFPAGPGLEAPPLSTMTPGTNKYSFWTPSASELNCAVPGYQELAAGSITVQPPDGNAVITQPLANANGFYYQQALPGGFVKPGTYSIAGQRTAAIWLDQSLTVGSGIMIENAPAPGTTLDANSLTVLTWKGGDPASIVRVTLYANSDLVPNPRNVWYESAAKGSLTLQAVCSGMHPKVCSYGLPTPSQHAILTIDVLPSNGQVQSVSVPGISQPVRMSWAYHYVFGGLSLAN